MCYFFIYRKILMFNFCKMEILLPDSCKYFESSFIVMPTDTNYMLPLIFGGAFMSKLDLVAASLVHRCVSHSDVVNNAVTHKASFEFLAPANMGDLILMSAVLTECKGKHFSIYVEAHKEERNTLLKQKIATSTFIFVTRKNEIYTRHNLIII
jgi:acyl-CoA hydrolase